MAGCTLLVVPESKATNQCPKFQCRATIPHSWGKEEKGQYQLDQLLSHAQVDLRDADIEFCKINSDFEGNDFTGATFVCDDLTGVRFKPPATLEKVEFTDCDMSEADLTAVIGSKIKFTSSKLSGSHFDAAKLKCSVFDRVDLKDATFFSTDMSGVMFAPDTLPNARSLARALNLSKIRAPYNEVALFQLRGIFRESGDVEQAREITYAIESGRQERYERECSTGLDSTLAINLGDRTHACAMHAIRAVAFSFTCHFGLTPWRPIFLLLGLWLVCTLLLAVIVASSRKKVVTVVVTRSFGGKNRVREYDICTTRERIVFSGHGVYQLFRDICRLICVSARLSLMNLFNLQFREVEVGKWLRMMSSRDYDLKPKGIARTVSGMESILSLYLIALWVLVYFGDPFLK